jgi:1,6-anhydro-N-acetylmuramate kinase
MKEKGRGRWTIAGFMSGTSLDGIDAGVVETDGVDILSLWRDALPALFRRRTRGVARRAGHLAGR